MNEIIKYTECRLYKIAQVVNIRFTNSIWYQFITNIFYLVENYTFFKFIYFKYIGMSKMFGNMECQLSNNYYYETNDIFLS